MLAGEKTPFENFLVKLFAVVPLLAVAAAVPLAWGWGLSWVDIGLAAGFYFFSCLGVTVGFHRYFTHGAFKAKRPLRPYVQWGVRPPAEMERPASSCCSVSARLTWSDRVATWCCTDAQAARRRRQA